MRGNFAFLLYITLFAAFLSPPVSATMDTELVIEDVTVIPMDKESYDEHQVVTLHNGVIIGIAKQSTSPRGPNTVVIDGRGKFLIPVSWTRMRTSFLYVRG
jgi:hypothetical protein